MACGIPSGMTNKIKLLIHNLKLDYNNIHEVLKSLEQRIMLIEDMISKEQLKNEIFNMEEDLEDGRTESNYYDEDE